MGAWLNVMKKRKSAFNLPSELQQGKAAKEAFVFLSKKLCEWWLFCSLETNLWRKVIKTGIGMHF